jgi:hypothetical protein
LKGTGLRGCDDSVADALKDVKPHLGLPHNLVMYNLLFKFE